jgi:hypothetical protein
MMCLKRKLRYLVYIILLSSLVLDHTTTTFALSLPTKPLVLKVYSNENCTEVGLDIPENQKIGILVDTNFHESNINIINMGVGWWAVIDAFLFVVTVITFELLVIVSKNSLTEIIPLFLIIPSYTRIFSGCSNIIILLNYFKPI